MSLYFLNSALIAVITVALGILVNSSAAIRAICGAVWVEGLALEEPNTKQWLVSLGSFPI